MGGEHHDADLRRAGSLAGRYVSVGRPTAELADWIAATGKRLSTIYITHAHPDHFFGLKLLRDRFPSARAVALPQVVESMHRALAPESVAEWKRRFPGQIPDRLVPAEALDDGTFSLD